MNYVLKSIRPNNFIIFRKKNSCVNYKFESKIVLERRVHFYLSPCLNQATVKRYQMAWIHTYWIYTYFCWYNSCNVLRKKNYIKFVPSVMNFRQNKYIFIYTMYFLISTTISIPKLSQ